MRSAAERRSQRSLLILLSVALAAKLFYLALLFRSHPGVYWNPDSPTYVRPALALLTAGRYAQNASVGAPPEINRTPGYPLLVAAVYAVAGERPVALAVVNVFLSTASALVLYLLARRLFGARAALLSAALLCVEPGTFRFSTVVLSETPFVLAVVGFLAAFERWSVAPRPAGAAGAGAILALSILIRPLLVPFVPIALVLAGALLVRRGLERKTIAANLAAFVAPIVLLVGAWVLRNERVAGRPLVTTIAEVNLYMYRGAKVEAAVTGESLASVQARFGWDEFLYRFGYVERESDVFGGRRYAEVHPETAALSAAELARLWGEKGRAILMAHPAVALEQAVKGASWLLLGPGAVNWAFALDAIPRSSPIVTSAVSGEGMKTLGITLREAPGVFLLSAAWGLVLVALYVAALAGAREALSGGRRLLHAAALALGATVIAVSAAPEAIDDRIRLPLMPLVCLYAGAGLAKHVHHPHENPS